MAGEATIINLLGNGGDPIEYTVSSANTIAKGTLMELQDNRTVRTNSAADKSVAGIAAAEKPAADDSTTISVYTNVIAKMTCGTTGCTCGHQAVAEGINNSVKDFDTLDSETGDVLGYFLGSAAATETVLVRIQK